MTDTAAHLHHELRTPLNHILGYTEMLLEEAAANGREDMVGELRAIHAEGQQLLARVGQVAGLGQGVPPDFVAPLRAIEAGVTGLSRRAASEGATDLLPDLARIRSASERLEAMLRDGPGAAPPSGSSRPTSAAPDTPAAIAGAPEPSRAHGRLLVVDDNQENRDMLGRRLAREGHEVQVVGSGEEALAFLAAADVDLVLLDVMMPGLDGYQVLQRLKADARLRAVPVLVISALDEIDSVVRCIELGADDYLTKPFDPVLLRARVGACLEKKQMRDQEVLYLAQLAEWNRTLERRVAEQVALVERLGRLKRFFSPHLAELIVAGGADDPMKTHRREITVVFIDLRGFTAFSETAEPEEVMGVLQEYHAAMGTLVLAHDGTLERFTGDGLVVFFNDPVPVPDSAERAVRMAVAMRDRVEELAARWRRRGWQLALGVGIAHGYATIGAIGYEGRWDYGAVGTVMNLAARLCAEAKSGQILVTPRVATTLEGLLEAEEIGALTLKGFSKPVPTFTVRGLTIPG